MANTQTFLMSGWLDRKRDLLTGGFKLSCYTAEEETCTLQIPSNGHENCLSIIALGAKYTIVPADFIFCHLKHKKVLFVKCSSCKPCLCNNILLILLSNAMTFSDFKCLKCIWLVHANMKDVHAYKTVFYRCQGPPTALESYSVSSWEN